MNKTNMFNLTITDDVGCVSLGCLARNGFSVIGVDLNENKIKQIYEFEIRSVQKMIKDYKKITRLKDLLFYHIKSRISKRRFHYSFDFLISAMTFSVISRGTSS